MIRNTIAPRPDWTRIAAEQGFVFASPDGGVYWDESAYYSFSLAQIEDDLEVPTETLYAMVRDLVGRIVEREDWLTLCGIPESAWTMIRESWRAGDPSLYGRFDLAYDGTGPAKMLEFNGDTPTSLYEAGYFQWHWLTDLMRTGALPAGTDQFSSIHERLVAGLAERVQGRLSLTCFSSEEDVATLAYLQACAQEAGLAAALVDIETVRTTGDGRLCGPDGDAFETLFKLYPWEWIHAEPLGPRFADRRTRFLEPAWKLVATSKGLLPLLWQLHPGHPNLLESYFESDPSHARLSAYARKPLFSREGANTLITDGTRTEATEGPFGGQPCVRQAYAPLCQTDGHHAVIGSWIIADAPAGIGIREAPGLITGDTARFVPHIIRAEAPPCP